MVVLVIAGILAAIAYPMYTQHVIKARRSAAQSFLLEVASRQERFLLDQRNYASSLGTDGLNVSIPDAVAAYYQVTLAVDNGAAPPLYTVVATPVPGTMQARDPVLTLDSFGIRVPADKWQ